MKNNKAEKIVYSLNFSDIQEVSQDVLERHLTKEELVSVGSAVGSYIDWTQAVEHAIREKVRG